MRDEGRGNDMRGTMLMAGVGMRLCSPAGVAPLTGGACPASVDGRQWPSLPRDPATPHPSPLPTLWPSPSTSHDQRRQSRTAASTRRNTNIRPHLDIERLLAMASAASNDNDRDDITVVTPHLRRSTQTPQHLRRKRKAEQTLQHGSAYPDPDNIYSAHGKVGVWEDKKCMMSWKPAAATYTAWAGEDAMRITRGLRE